MSLFIIIHKIGIQGVLSLNKCPSLTYEYIYILILNVLGAIIIPHLHIHLTTTDPISRPTVSGDSLLQSASVFDEEFGLEGSLSGSFEYANCAQALALNVVENRASSLNWLMCVLSLALGRHQKVSADINQTRIK